MHATSYEAVTQTQYFVFNYTARNRHSRVVLHHLWFCVKLHKYSWRRAQNVQVLRWKLALMLVTNNQCNKTLKSDVVEQTDRQT